MSGEVFETTMRDKEKLALPSKTGKCHSDEQQGAEGLCFGSVRKCDVKTFGSL